MVICIPQVCYFLTHRYSSCLFSSDRPSHTFYIQKGIEPISAELWAFLRVFSMDEGMQQRVSRIVGTYYICVEFVTVVIEMV